MSPLPVLRLLPRAALATEELPSTAPGWSRTPELKRRASALRLLGTNGDVLAYSPR